MSDFLGNLAARALGAAPTVRPRAASLFEPVAAAAASPTEAFDEWDAAPAPIPTEPPRLLPAPPGMRSQRPVIAAKPFGEPEPSESAARAALTEAMDPSRAAAAPQGEALTEAADTTRAELSPQLLRSTREALEHRLTDEQTPAQPFSAPQPGRGKATHAPDVAYTRPATDKGHQAAAETAAIREAAGTAIMATPHSALRTPHSPGAAVRETGQAAAEATPVISNPHPAPRTPHSPGTAVQLAGSSEGRTLQGLDATAQPIRKQAVAAGENSVLQTSEAATPLIRTPHSALRTQSIVAQPQVRAYTPPAAEADRGQAQGQAEPAIHVTIGRIEVRAVQQPSGARPRQLAPAPALSLEDYLNGRGGKR